MLRHSCWQGDACRLLKAPVNWGLLPWEIPESGCLCVSAPGQRSCLCLGVSSPVKSNQLLFRWIRAGVEIPAWYLSLCFSTASSYSGEGLTLSSVALKDSMNYLKYFQSRFASESQGLCETTPSTPGPHHHLWRNNRKKQDVTIT